MSFLRPSSLQDEICNLCSGSVNAVNSSSGDDFMLLAVPADGKLVVFFYLPFNPQRQQSHRAQLGLQRLFSSRFLISLKTAEKHW